MIKRITTENRIPRLLDSYPRERPPLSEAHRAGYVDEYKINRDGKGALYKILSLLERWGHNKVSDQQNDGDILEIGAGTLNHVPYESGIANYDCIEPFQELFANSPHSGLSINFAKRWTKLATRPRHQSSQRQFPLY